ncbi:hypothetical protein MTR67_044204 [Solanum verrucosum]|uniref:Polyprotein protein n=1 Tax=Solanum verrucosum TaxID=315347 RepID=A0AAF0UT27_SOLVR|nr:hypothetical protein MTR67_044204 [Solanum verrucosum]
MIERDIVIAIAPIQAELREHRELITAYGTSLDALTVRMEACEQSGRQSADVTALRADITNLKGDVDELESMDLSIFFGTVDLPEVPSIYLPHIFVIPPATTIGDSTVVDDDVDSDAPENNEEENGTRDAVVYDDLEDLEGAMVKTTMETSLRDASMVGSSREKDGSKSGTDAQINRVLDVQSSP